MKTLTLILLTFVSVGTFAQVGIGTTTPDPSAILDIQSTTQGVLFPRMTTAQINAIVDPAPGLRVTNMDTGVLYTNTGTSGSPIWAPDNSGWHGSKTRIKILPSDFMATPNSPDNNGTKIIGYPKTGSIEDPFGVFHSDDQTELVAFVPIPSGFKATHVKINGLLSLVDKQTGNIYVYEQNIDSGTRSLSKGSASINTEIDIEDVESTETNYLVVIVDFDKDVNFVYGGYVTIAPL